jgi:Holliday junction resolvasome RuvABC endonuclease subunit
MPSLLAIDLSTVTGWAWWKDHAQPPLCGTERLPKVHDPADYGRRTHHLDCWLRDFLAVHPTDAVAYESPFIPMSMFAPKDGDSAFNTTMHTLRLQMALATIIENVAFGLRKRCVEASTQSCKVAMVGFGRKPKDQPKFDWKKEMLIAATRQGYRVANDHEADAVAVGKVAAMHLWGLTV